jgi:peptidyl-prolyl cis-trans isomerase SurA
MTDHVIHPLSISPISIFSWGYLIVLLLIHQPVMAQDDKLVVDQVVAVVGGEAILESDIETQYLQYRAEQPVEGSSSSIKCRILERLMFQKLLLVQAELDSVEVSESQVEQEMDRRLRYFIAQFGSQEKLEEFYQKSIIEIKDEFRDLIRDQIMEDNAQRTITENVKITPSEVKEYFRSLGDSIPLINSEMEIGQIVKKPNISVLEKEAVKTRLLDIRDQILRGKSFSAMARLYSEDQGSAQNGGELGLTQRGTLYPEFEAVAFKLKEGEISDVVETKAGFHILQLIERRGEFVNVRHILLRPKVSMAELGAAKTLLDSIALLIDGAKLTFEEAVVKFSDDPSKNNNGLVVNAATGTSLFEADQLDPKVFFVIDKLQVGEISVPVPFKTEEGNDAYRILCLRKRTQPHKANMKDDYDKIQTQALEEKKSRAISGWISGKASKTYIKINENYRNCEFENNWFSM